jgi:hypothetical protein
MSRKTIMNPLIAIEENCTMLKEAGADNKTINYFLLEAIAELEGEIETTLINEFSITDFLGGVGGTIKGGLGIIGDSVKEKITRFILDKFGIADGWIKEIIVKFVGNLTIRECISLVRGDLDCDVIMTKSAQTMAEVVAEKYLINPLVQGSESGVNPGSTKASKDSQIGELLRGIIRNALSGSDEDSPLPKLLKPHMKPICDFFDETSDSIKGALMQENFHRELININSQKVIKEGFQKRMKVRLKKSMKTILDGGRKDLVKYGKPWNQGRQKYSNAFAANEITSMAAGIEGAPMTLKNKEENTK